MGPLPQPGRSLVPDDSMGMQQGYIDSLSTGDLEASPAEFPPDNIVKNYGAVVAKQDKRAMCQEESMS